MALVLTMLTLAAPTPTPTPASETRHAQRAHADARHAERRALRAERRRARKRLVVRPYRSWLRSTRMCESGGRYAINTGNGFYGAYQFTLSSWRYVGGRGWPHHARRLEQDYRAVRLLHVQGRGAWPVCG